MAQIIQAPRRILKPTVFLGGSITGAWDWQAYACSKLQDEDIVIFNPRRDNFNVADRQLEVEQISWEFNHLRMADALIFWFSGETLAPITLFELGRHSIIAGRPLFIGCDPAYARRRDVEIQMGLVQPSLPIHINLDIVLSMFRSWLNS